MYRKITQLIYVTGIVGFNWGVIAPAIAQTPPTYAPSGPLVAPAEPLVLPEPTLPKLPVPTPANGTIPDVAKPVMPSDSLQSTPVPGNTFKAPAAAPYETTPPLIVTPASPESAVSPETGWYPGYWLGYRRNQLPYGRGPLPYETNYQGFGQGMGVPMNSAPGCNTCPQPVTSPCGPTNLDFGRGYDGFFSGW
ncbi:hypothetical protein SH668x_000720 [Planctomicrobium sp. SH668]|uniref:hypothetical protein n=1 Tax=Planctomicrobium sp. SH668 TaxID=3448126 RepID=UPI003F5BF1C0